MFFLGSWRTKIVGISKSLIIIITGIVAMADLDPATQVDVEAVGAALVDLIYGLGLYSLLGVWGWWIVREEKVTSEEAGAKEPTKKQPPMSPLLFLLVALTTTISQAQGWRSTLTESQQNSILWFADHEEGTLTDWTQDQYRYAGGGIFNSGPSDDVVSAATREEDHGTGCYSAVAMIRNAYRAQNGSRGVRLMRWTDTAWDNRGQYLPDRCYFSTWVYFPYVYNPNKYDPWDPGDGGWWNIFQFKSDDHHGNSQPMFTLNVAHDDARGTMHLYWYSKVNRPRSYGQDTPIPLPVRQWVHLEAYLESATNKRGQLILWQDGQKIFDLQRKVTSLGGETGDDTHPIWGIGNYTDHIDGHPLGEGIAELYFDDCAISTEPLH